MALKKTQTVKDVNESPVSVYIGADIIEGYGKLRVDEVDVPPKHREAMDAAILMANKNAVEKALAQSKLVEKPDCKGGKLALSIRISPPRIDMPYTNDVSIYNLPLEAQALAKTSRHGERYVITSVSVMWTARWICIPKGGYPGLPKDTITASNARTHIGDKIFDFGCPHPSSDGVVAKETDNVHKENPRYTLLKFQEDYPNFINVATETLIKDTLDELGNAMMVLPKCPAECPETQLSVTLGYPQPMSVVGAESIVVEERDGYNEKYQRVKVPYDLHNYKVKGKWSWTVQRTCCAD